MAAKSYLTIDVAWKAANSSRKIAKSTELAARVCQIWARHASIV